MQLVVGEGLRRMVAAFMALAPFQQRFLEGVILSWAARHEATAIGAVAMLDVDTLPVPESKNGMSKIERGASDHDEHGRD